MIKKRMIFTLLYDDGDFVLSRNFNRQKIGDNKWLDINYNFSSIHRYIDEMIILNISNLRNDKNKKNFINCLRKISKNCFVPITSGGGISSIKDAKDLLDNGADKIAINTKLYKKDFIKKLALKFGRQCIVGSIDFKKNEKKKYSIFLNNGKRKLNISIKKFSEDLDSRFIGEMLINSIDKDGTGTGLDFEVLHYFKKTRIPIIFQGGVGNSKHFIEGLKNKDIQAVSTANILNFIDDGLKYAREQIMKQKVNLPVR